MQADRSDELVLQTTRFELLRRLGSGGMGTVYEARDRTHGGSVALKVLRDATGDGVRRFKNEFRALQDLHHDNLVTLGELVEEQGRWYFTMEMIEGVDFLRWVRPGGIPSLAVAHTDVNGDTIDYGLKAKTPVPVGAPDPKPSGAFDEAKLRDALGQLALGLDALHRGGKVHRDVKPSNVLVTPAGRVVVLDFGLVTDAELSDERNVVGTVSFMAPEQAGEQPVGPPADWYAFGVVLYLALTGRMPFSGAPDMILEAKRRYDPAPPSELEPRVPADLDALCRELLARDPARRLNGADVLRRLGRQAPRDELRAPFVGRSSELERLTRAVASSRQQASMVFLQGESGVGKTALVRELLHRLDGDGTQVLVGRCYERESVPYKGCDGVIDELARRLEQRPPAEQARLAPPAARLLSQVFPALARVEAFAQAPQLDEVRSPQELRNRVFSTVRELLRRVAAEAPLVLVLDDLQWADADGLALLAEVLRAPSAPRVLVIAAVRGDADAVIDLRTRLGLRDAVAVEILPITRLSSDEARELATRLIGDRAQAEAIAAESEGHPLFLDALARHAMAGLTGASPRLDEAIWARVQRLEPGARRMLAAAAVATRPLPIAVAADAAELAAVDLERCAGELRAAHLLRGEHGAIEPYHDRVRQAVLERLPDDEQRGWHARLAASLETRGGDAEVLAIHFEEAGDPEKARRYAVTAARQAFDALAFDRAAQLYRRALALTPAAGEERRELQALVGDACAFAGRGGEAAQAYLDAAALGPQGEAFDLERKAAEQLLLSGHVDRAMATLQPVLEALKLKLPSTPRRALLSLIFRRLQVRLRGMRFRPRPPDQIDARDLTRVDVAYTVAVGLGLIDIIRGADFQSRHIVLALDVGEPYRLARAVAVESAYASTAGRDRAPRLRQLLEDAERLAKESGHPHAIAWAAGAAGFADAQRGRWKRAIGALDRAEAILRDRCVGVAWELATVRLALSFSLIFSGQMGEATRRTLRWYTEAQARNDLYAITTLATGPLNSVWLALDQPEVALEEADQALRRWSHRGFHLQHLYGLFARAFTALYTGDTERSYAEAHSEGPALKGSLLLRFQSNRIPVAHLRARSALARAVKEPAARAALLAESDAEARRLDHERMDWSTPLAALQRAAAAHLRGDDPAALTLLDAAATGLDGADMIMHAASARLVAGRLAGGDEGRAAAERAITALRACGVVAPLPFARMLVVGFDDRLDV